MMWLAGVSPLDVLEAYLPAIVAILLVGYFAARKQHAYSPIIKSTTSLFTLIGGEPASSG